MLVAVGGGGEVASPKKDRLGIDVEAIPYCSGAILFGAASEALGGPDLSGKAVMLWTVGSGAMTLGSRDLGLNPISVPYYLCDVGLVTH